MIKIYEAIRQNNARLVTRYCNVDVTLNFIDGNIYQGKNAQLKTNDKFVQDAIEHDSRFGVTIRLKQTIKEESDNKVEAKATAPEAETKKGKKGKGKAEAETLAKAEGTVVESVKNMNDAVDYFAEKGELVESVDEVKEMCEKYGVTMPNLKV